jgi:hypothetical protein
MNVTSSPDLNDAAASFSEKGVPESSNLSVFSFP